MSQTTWKIIGTALVFGILTIGNAQAAEKARVRGVVERLDGDTLIVKSKGGQTVTVSLKSGWAIGGVINASIADVKPGDYVGIASVPTENGTNGALEVLIFPAALKGTAEGDFAYDLQPKSSMTNATVASAVASVNGPTLTLAYKGGEKKISVPSGTPVVTIAKATKDDVKPGAGVVINGEKTGDNKVESDRVLVGLNGVVPPM